jgi:hypothetical protein
MPFRLQLLFPWNGPAHQLRAEERTVSDQEPQPLQIVLTPEQREQIHRASGQFVDAIEVAPEDSKKSGGTLKFRWRLSAASGIPRQSWGVDDKP